MKAWREYMTPSKEHQEMAKEVGDWTFVSKMWMAPDQPPQESTGTTKISMIMDGRYQVQDVTGSMMGMPFTGKSLVGFDNQTKEFTNVWIDSLGTGTFVAKGKRDEKGAIHCSGDMIMPGAGACPTRTVVTKKDADNIVFEMYSTPPGAPAESKVMELTYTRKK